MPIPPRHLLAARPILSPGDSTLTDKTQALRALPFQRQLTSELKLRLVRSQEQSQRGREPQACWEG